MLLGVNRMASSSLKLPAVTGTAPPKSSKKFTPVMDAPPFSSQGSVQPWLCTALISSTSAFTSVLRLSTRYGMPYSSWMFRPELERALERRS